jgi:hypothetical protein
MRAILGTTHQDITPNKFALFHYKLANEVISTWNSVWKLMSDNLKDEKLVVMRKQLAWLLAQAAEYDSGRPEAATENFIYAAQKCAEVAAMYRRQAETLQYLIAATEEPDC